MHYCIDTGILRIFARNRRFLRPEQSSEAGIEDSLMLKMEELRDKKPFHCIITGPTNCGKTRYVIDQLRGSFRHVFDWIVLICPTYSKNKTYRGFAKGDKRFVVLSPDASNVEEINDLLGICEDFFSGKNTLIILDDCAVSKDLKIEPTSLLILRFSGRHAGFISLGFNATTYFDRKTVFVIMLLVWWHFITRHRSE